MSLVIYLSYHLVLFSGVGYFKRLHPCLLGPSLLILDNKMMNIKFYYLTLYLKPKISLPFKILGHHLKYLKAYFN